MNVLSLLPRLLERWLPGGDPVSLLLTVCAVGLMLLTVVGVLMLSRRVRDQRRLGLCRDETLLLRGLLEKRQGAGPAGPRIDHAA